MSYINQKIKIFNHTEQHKYLRLNFTDIASIGLIFIWAIYYVYGIFFRENINFVIIIYTLVAFMFFLIFYLMYGLTGGMTIVDNYSLFFIFIILMTGIPGAFTGVFLNNHATYTKWFFADFYKFTIVPLVGYMVYSSKKNIDLKIIMNIYMLFEFIGIIVGLVAIYYKIIFRAAGAGNGLPLILIFLLFSIVAKGKKERRKTITTWLGLLIVLIYVILMKARLIILELVIISMLIVIMIIINRRRYSLKKFICFLIIALFFLSMLYMYNNNFQLNINSYFARVEHYKTDISILGRFIESQAALKEIAKNTFYFIFGKGFGGTYYSARVFEWAGAEIYNQTDYMVHNIHIGPLNVWLHAGLFGVIIYYLVFPLIFWKTRAKAITNIYSYTLFLWVIMKLFESFAALRFIGDAPSFVLLAYYFTCCKKMNKSI
ncbi:hypothetical protein CVT91_08050 [Candidatus Atribacteria bacterium HGW-Atribacteria-1]|nr:MAG: hypothetical protein CVT91_08050 [Candidatus Atribacteria bacterium HGW-Atribacteria-1]